MSHTTSLFDADTRQPHDVAGRRAHVLTPPLNAAHDGATAGMKTPRRIALTVIAVSVLGLPAMASRQTAQTRNTVQALRAIWKYNLRSARCPGISEIRRPCMC
jgi:hypothetical protein